jgi:hypothetical protein
LALAEALPGLDIPLALSDKAEAGLAVPEQLDSNLSKAIPAILAARPARQNATWQENITDRIWSLLAISPAGEVSGDTPEARIARLESAIARRDYKKANELMLTLPAPMRVAAGDSVGQIADLALADEFAQKARQAALVQPTPDIPGTAQ